MKDFVFYYVLLIFLVNMHKFIPLKDKKRTTITNAFQNILDESNCKPNKIWVKKGSDFYIRPIKSFLQNDNIEMYSTHNERKSVVSERFIRT